MRSLKEIKEAVRLQKLLDDPPEAPKSETKPVPVAWLWDWSFWDPAQRRAIAEELLRYRGNK